MTLSNIVLSSLLTLVALVDSTSSTPSCINSSVVKSISIDSKAPSDAHGLKERFTNPCGPIDLPLAGKINAIGKWFEDRIPIQPIDIRVVTEGGFEVGEGYFSLPLQLIGDSIVVRMVTKVLLRKSSRLHSPGIGEEIAIDMILSDIFGSNFVAQDISTDHLGVFGEFGPLSRDCHRGMVPLDLLKELCTEANFKRVGFKISPWSLRWIALTAFNYRNHHGVLARISTSRNLLEVSSNLIKESSFDEYFRTLNHIEITVQNLFKIIGEDEDCFNRWRKEYQKPQLLITPQLADLKIDSPRPLNTLILDSKGLHLVTGEMVDLDEGEVMSQSERVAFIGCVAPTMEEVIQYTARDKRLLFIESCHSDQPLRLGLYASHGPEGIAHQNPSHRFARFHLPSVRLAMDWGLRGHESLIFSRDNSVVPEKLKRLFGWNDLGEVRKKEIFAPLPIVDYFNIRKSETLSLKRYSEDVVGL